MMNRLFSGFLMTSAVMLTACSSDRPASAEVNDFDCPAVAGMEALAESEATFLFFGETHGTVEGPAALGDILCNLAEKGSVLLALELEVEWQAPLQSYVNLTAAEATSDVELAGQDGRWTEATAGLVNRARMLNTGGADIDLTTFATLGNEMLEALSRGEAFVFDQNQHEIRMAEALRTAASRRNYDRVVVLVGGVHAAKADIENAAMRATIHPTGEQEPLPVSDLTPMAALFDDQEALRLNMTFDEGETASEPSARVELDPGNSHYDGTWILATSTPSPRTGMLALP